MTTMTTIDPTDYEARLRATLGPLDGRCLRCKWTLAPNKREGCVPGNCAYRPGGNEQFTPAQVTVRAEDLADLIAEVKRLRAENEALRESLTWCGGSPSFSPGGEAREEWERVVLPLLTRSGA